jgi:hypothetical protein
MERRIHVEHRRTFFSLGEVQPIVDPELRRRALKIGPAPSDPVASPHTLGFRPSAP